MAKKQQGGKVDPLTGAEPRKVAAAKRPAPSNDSSLDSVSATDKPTVRRSGGPRTKVAWEGPPKGRRS